jgi:hypothetical protein
MFYTDCIAYPFGVDSEQKNHLIDEGYLVYEDIESAFQNLK